MCWVHCSIFHFLNATREDVAIRIVYWYIPGNVIFMENIWVFVELIWLRVCGFRVYLHFHLPPWCLLVNKWLLEQWHPSQETWQICLPFLGLTSPLTFWSNGNGLSGSPLSSLNLQQTKNVVVNTNFRYTTFIINALHSRPWRMHAIWRFDLFPKWKFLYSCPLALTDRRSTIRKIHLF